MVGANACPKNKSQLFGENCNMHITTPAKQLGLILRTQLLLIFILM